MSVSLHGDQTQDGVPVPTAVRFVESPHHVDKMDKTHVAQDGGTADHIKKKVNAKYMHVAEGPGRLLIDTSLPQEWCSRAALHVGVRRSEAGAEVSTSA